jgi:hypothetical protein
MLSFRNLWEAFRNHCGLEFVQPLINIRLGTGRGFRYACSEKLPIVFRTPRVGVGQHTREVVFVEARSTPRLAMSAIGEMEWVI